MAFFLFFSSFFPPPFLLLLFKMLFPFFFSLFSCFFFPRLLIIVLSGGKFDLYELDIETRYLKPEAKKVVDLPPIDDGLVQQTDDNIEKHVVPLHAFLEASRLTTFSLVSPPLSFTPSLALLAPISSHNIIGLSYGFPM